MKKTKNPFKDLKIQLTERGAVNYDGNVKQKVFFEGGSHEASLVEVDKRINILAKIIFNGYDLNQVVHQYLDDKVALNDITRINEIIVTFKSYTYRISPATEKEMKEKFNEFLSDYNNKTIKRKLKEAISEFEKTVNNTYKKDFSLILPEKEYTTRDLLKAYVKDDKTKYKIISSNLNIDLDEDVLNNSIYKNEEKRHFYKYYEKLLFYFRKDLIDCIKDTNRILSPLYMSDLFQFTPSFYQALAATYYLYDLEKIRKDENYRTDNILSFAERIVGILWENQPFFDEEVYWIRTNYTGSAEKHINELYEKDLISICIQDFEKDDLQNYNELMANNSPKKHIPYVRSFVNLVKAIKKKDVIVFVSYKDRDIKMGLIKKGTATVEKLRKEKDELSLYCVQFKQLKKKTFQLKENPILKILIPKGGGTINHIINHRKNIAYYLFYNIIPPLDLSLMTYDEIEKLCLNWIKSEYIDEDYQIVRPIIETGKGNIRDIDILGMNSKGEIIAVQVSFTDETKLLNKKAKNLINTKGADKYVMFTNVKDNAEFVGEIRQIYIGDVFKKLKSDLRYDSFFKELAINNM